MVLDKRLKKVVNLAILTVCIPEVSCLDWMLIL